MSPAMGSATNYYSWIASHFQPLLGNRVLDIGGGRGRHLDFVVNATRFVMSLDLSPEAVREMKERFSGKAFDAFCGDIVDAHVIERLGAESFDTILCVNVLEHIERDDLALHAMRTILKPCRGRLFLLVPAHPILYGTPDRLAGHFRRYRRRELEERVKTAGFDSVRTRYFNTFGAIPYGLNSRILRPSTLSGPVDAQIVLFDRFFVPALRRLESGLSLPFGQSLIATAQAGA